MACSYHHAGHFQPSISSIEIAGNPKEGFKVSFYAAPQEGHLACDGCRGLQEPRGGPLGNSPLGTERWERGGAAAKGKEISWEEGLTFVGLQQPFNHLSK